MRVFTTVLLLFSQMTFASFDWSDYSDMLGQYVAEGEKKGIRTNLLDYKAFAQDPRYTETLKALEAYNPSSLEDKEKLNFYINAYNFLAINIVIKHMPVKSIKDIGSWFSPVWGKDAGKINGKNITLDKIEHKILRKMGEPRIHFAIVCASLSCPDLRKEAYTTEKLDEQLDDQARNFLANTTKGMSIKDNTLYLSKIFSWFEEDFEGQNKGEKGVLQYISRYNIEAGRFGSFRTLSYNWKLNQK